jgi:hypothetical protein
VDVKVGSITNYTNDSDSEEETKIKCLYDPSDRNDMIAMGNEKNVSWLEMSSGIFCCLESKNEHLLYLCHIIYCDTISSKTEA